MANNGNTGNKEQEQRIEAVKAALEWSKQILTLATGTLVLSGTFIKDIFKSSIKNPNLIMFSWILMSLSILFGILFLGKMVNILNEKKGEEVDVYSAKGVGIIHVAAFFFGLLFFIFFVYRNF